ncbi:MAG: hypothetical protein KGR26_13430, partial [Cyanobacteria bacterium REEB65]|nr:hypothetical protein [Cyanobacteria bacterium REEB65]
MSRPELTGIVVRRISNVFWVRVAGDSLELACSMPARLRKEQVDVRIGDRVTLADLDPVNAKGLIAEVLPRGHSLN